MCVGVLVGTGLGANVGNEDGLGVTRSSHHQIQSGHFVGEGVGSGTVGEVVGEAVGPKVGGAVWRAAQ
jgi:hypothetical protein